MKYHHHIFNLSLLLLLASCASQTTPMGGPKDTTPPTLISSAPEHNQANFHGKIVTLTFDENIALNNPKEQILITPTPLGKINYSTKVSKVLIEPENGWADSTTYSLTFREGIQDITEKNSPVNLRLAFSTGPYVDSLSLSGRIKDALTEQIPKDITVALYESDTFNIFEDIPMYVTKTDKSGNFILENLKPANYHVYAFSDKNKNLIIESKSEAFGSFPKSVNPEDTTNQIEIPILHVDTRPLVLASMRQSIGVTRFTFNKAITQYELKFDSTQEQPDTLHHSFGDDQTQLVIYHSKINPDSISVNLTALDSVEQRLDTTLYLKPTETKTIKPAFSYKLDAFHFNYPSQLLTLSVPYTLPLQTINLDSLYIPLDSLHTLQFSATEMQTDTIHKKLTFQKHIPADSLFKDQKNSISLYAGKSFLISILNDSSRKQQTKLIKLPPDKTGTLLIDVETEQQNYIIQLLDTKDNVLDTISNQKHPVFNYLPASNYKLRVIIDANGNHIWDYGNPLKNIPPETLYYYTTDDKTSTFPIRANWEYGPLLLKF